MKMNVTFKNIKASEGLREYVQEKLNRFDKLLDKPGIADVVFQTEKLRRIVEVTITSGRIGVHAREEHTEMRAAIDLVLDKLRKQITSTKDKLRQGKARPSHRTPERPEVAQEEAPAL